MDWLGEGNSTLFVQRIKVNLFHGKSEWWRIASEVIPWNRGTERPLSSGHLNPPAWLHILLFLCWEQSLQSVTFVTVAIISGESPVLIITALDILHIICTLHNNTDRRHYYSHFINNETGQWYSGKPVLQKKKKKFVFVGFVKFHGVNSPTVPGSRYQALTTSSQSSWILNNPGCSTPFKQGGANLGDLATSPGSYDMYKSKRVFPLRPEDSRAGSPHQHASPRSMLISALDSARPNLYSPKNKEFSQGSVPPWTLPDHLGCTVLSLLLHIHTSLYTSLAHKHLLIY